MEGVLMRGRDAIAVALRHPDGRIVTATERLESRIHTSRVAKWPFVRGLVVLYETLVIGTRWLIRSANVQAEEDDVELGKGSILVTLLITFGVAIAIFSLLPLFVSSVATSGASQGWAQPALEGLIQVGLFLGVPDARVAHAGHPPGLPVPRRRAHDDPRPRGRRPADGRRGPQVPDRPPPLRHRVPRDPGPAVDLRLLAGRQAGAARDDREPVHRRSRSSRPWATRSSSSARGSAITGSSRAIMFPGILVQMITTKRPDRRHDRGRHLVDGGSARAPTGTRSRRARRSSSAHPLELPSTDAPPEATDPVAATSPGEPPAAHMSDLDAKLAEIATQYDDLQAELARPEVTRRPERDPPARARAGPPRADGRCLPPPAGDRARSWPARASCATRSDGDDEMRAMARDEIGPARGRRDATARGAARSSSCRATRTTTAT